MVSIGVFDFVTLARELQQIEGKKPALFDTTENSTRLPCNPDKMVLLSIGSSSLPPAALEWKSVEPQTNIHDNDVCSM